MKPTSLLFFGALVALGRADAPDGRPVLNSFINHRVLDGAALVAHVRADPVVADRYRRHFAMDQAALLRYLSGLHRAPLAKDGVFNIYSVPRGGRLKMHVGRLRRGEPMFLDRSGAPILVVKCGNPVVLGPARPQSPNLLVNEPLKDRDLRPLAFSSVPEPSPVDMFTLMPSVPSVVPATSTAAQEGAVPASAVEPRSFALMAPLFILIGGGTTLSLPTPSRNPTPVPEPASLLALAAGALTLARRRRAA